MTVVLMPVMEELVFRHAIFRAWRSRWGAGRAALASSLLFGLVHFDAVGIGFAGLMTVLIYTRTRSLWGGIAMHCIHNGALELLRHHRWRVPEGFGNIPDVAFFVVGGALVALSSLWLIMFVRTSWQTLAAPLPPDLIAST